MLTEDLVKLLLLKSYLIKISSNFSQHQFKISKSTQSCDAVLRLLSTPSRLEVASTGKSTTLLLLARACPCLVVLHDLLLDLLGGPLGVLSPEAGVGRLVELEEP